MSELLYHIHLQAFDCVPLITLYNQMKNWKRRFFVLTEASLAYYKTFEVSWYTCMYFKGLF